MDLHHEMSERAAAIKKAGGVTAAVESGLLEKFQTMTVSEALVVGLLKQGVRKYLAIFGHGSTDIGNVLRLYEEAGLVRTLQARNEVAMAHTATALKWQYGETPAVLTSIGPGALQALAGSLTAITNGIGVYHIYGDETTYREGYNFQQIRKREQHIYARMTSLAGESYFLHTPEAMRDMLRRGTTRVNHPYRAGPFYVHLPMNVQPALIHDLNLLALPDAARSRLGSARQIDIEEAASLISQFDKIVIKAGGGARAYFQELRCFAEQIGAAVVSSPVSQGVLPDSHPQYLHVSGTKGTLSGNFAAQNAELLIVIGSRAVCQADSSGLGYPSAKAVININADIDDVNHYNKTVPLVGDIGETLEALGITCGQKGANASRCTAWLKQCLDKKIEWKEFRSKRYRDGRHFDDAWQAQVLTQAAALKTIIDFAKSIDVVKYFDAGDVQSNGLQICEDETPFDTITDGGASFMGFAISALIAYALADKPRYGMAVVGDGSFWMSPQVLIDAVEHKVKGMVVVLDNRRMSSITGLQRAQYGEGYRTHDDVAIDYRSLCAAINGLTFFDAGTDAATLQTALTQARQVDGMSLVHVKVLWDETGKSNLGAFGRWNVGSWVEAAQRDYLKQDL